MTGEEHVEFQDRQEQHEPDIIRLILDWIIHLITSVPLDLIAQALGGNRDVGSVVYQLPSMPALDLGHIAAAEAEHALTEPPLERANLRFDMQDPRFQAAVYDHGMRLASGVDAQTREAVKAVIAQGRRHGLHPYQFASAIRETIGLDERRAVAVANYADNLAKSGMDLQRAGHLTERYALKLRTQRAKTIARTETIAAATIGRVQAFEQARRHGLVDSTAMLEWIAIQDDPREICFQLNGEQVPLGETFDGLMPPAHPNCRCTVWLVTP